MREGVLGNLSLRKRKVDAPVTALGSEEVLRADDVHKFFGSFEVLRGISCSIRRGEVVVIIGPSGAGKSTFLRCINGLEPFQRGDINVNGLRLKDANTDVLQSQSDVLRAQMELTRLVNRVTTQTLSIDSARAELNALLSRGCG